MPTFTTVLSVPKVVVSATVFGPLVNALLYWSYRRTVMALVLVPFAVIEAVAAVTVEVAVEAGPGVMANALEVAVSEPAATVAVPCNVLPVPARVMFSPDQFTAPPLAVAEVVPSRVPRALLS